MKIIIRKVKNNEVDKFYDFFKKSLSPLFPEYNKKEVNFMLTKGWTKERLINSLKNKKKILFSAFDGNKIIGTLEAETPFMGVAFGVWLMVDKKYQRKGIGSQLIEKFEKTVKKMGAHSTYLYTSDKNLDYYKNRGYEFVGVHKKAWLGQDHYYFAKQIGKPKEENYLKSSK